MVIEGHVHAKAGAMPAVQVSLVTGLSKQWQHHACLLLEAADLRLEILDVLRCRHSLRAVLNVPPHHVARHPRQLRTRGPQVQLLLWLHLAIMLRHIACAITLQMSSMAGAQVDSCAILLSEASDAGEPLQEVADTIQTSEQWLSWSHAVLLRTSWQSWQNERPTKLHPKQGVAKHVSCHHVTAVQHWTGSPSNLLQPLWRATVRERQGAKRRCQKHLYSSWAKLSARERIWTLKNCGGRVPRAPRTVVRMASTTVAGACGWYTPNGEMASDNDQSRVQGGAPGWHTGISG